MGELVGKARQARRAVTKDRACSFGLPSEEKKQGEISSVGS